MCVVDENTYMSKSVIKYAGRTQVINQFLRSQNYNPKELNTSLS